MGAMTDTSRCPFRAVVTTDPELDDLNSMLRLLLYGNEIEIAGLVYSSSKFHWAGDPTLGIEPRRWPAPGDVLHIDCAVEAYAEVYDTLVRHDVRYPHPDHLRSMIRMGNVLDEGDMREPTPGSELIVDVLLEDDPRPVFLQAWGGLNTIARALQSIEERYSGTAGWETIRNWVVDRAVITSFWLQDDTFTEYIRPVWPEIEHRDVATMIWGYLARDVVLPEDAHTLSPEWTRVNVTEVGPMGAAVRVWGDGLQMAAGFDEGDFFGIAGATKEELEAQGYWVWMPPQEAGGFISEGDSSNFALLIDNGLRSWQHPSFGGWGGRQTQSPDDPNQWSNEHTHDAAPDGTTPKDYHAARWWGAIQRDYAARLRWTVTREVAAANHHPVIEITQGLELTAAPDTDVRLDATVSDPDGDHVDVTWWQYCEAGTYPGRIELHPDGPTSVVVKAPADAQSGQTIHVIAEATDDGTPPLTRYQRVIITVA